MFELHQVDKHFPGVHALKAVDFTIGRGEIVGLVGENGAGKSTLMKIIYGAYQHDAGEVTVNGETARFQNPRQAMDRGVGMVFQEQSLIPNLTVMENIFLGFEQPFKRYGIINWRRMANAARAQLAKVELDVDPSMITSRLSFAQRQLVELAKVLTLEERVDGDLVILLDEPTSVLAREEVELLFRLVRELRVRASFIFVSHRLDEVIALSDRIYVMKDGEVVDVVAGNEAVLEDIQHKMVGRSINTEYYREALQKPYDSNTVLMALDSVSHNDHYRDISLSLHAGETLCLVGTEGSGREAILRTIYGLMTPDSGAVEMRGKRLTTFSASNGVQLGVGYVPRERKTEGIVSGMTLYENITLPRMADHARAGLLNTASERALADTWINKLSIKAPSANVDCGNLSGGNQQKVVLSKWRSADAQIFLLDHPTRGLDIGAKEDVYDLVREMNSEGVGVILIADTLEEAIGLSHNIIVIKDGEVQQWFDCVNNPKPSLYDLVHHMT